jgi:hypothetical protein
MTITQDIIRYKTTVSHKHMVVIYYRNTPLLKVRKGHVHTYSAVYAFICYNHAFIMIYDSYPALITRLGTQIDSSMLLIVMCDQMGTF